jgi:hypothetical protein
MSLLEPVVVSPKTMRSETLPPSRPAILSSNSDFDWRYRSSVGRAIVYPRAMPRLMIVTFWTGSHFGRIRCTTA